MADRQPPFDYARASALMDEQGVEALLVCSRANVGYLADWDHTLLEPGMVVCLEPTMRVVGVGSVNIEDMVVVTDDGCEPLTTFPRDLLVFGEVQ